MTGHASTSRVWILWKIDGWRSNYSLMAAFSTKEAAEAARSEYIRRVKADECEFVIHEEPVRDA